MTDTVGRESCSAGRSVISNPRQSSISGGRPGLGGHCHGQCDSRGARGPQFNARTADGINYRVPGVAGPDTIMEFHYPRYEQSDRQNLLRCHRPIANHRRG